MISKNLKVARRYAKAFLSLAQEHQFLERAYEDMKLVHQVFEAEKELKILMKSPIVREGKKQKILLRIFEQKIHPLMMKYLLIIARKGRASLLEGIAHEFQVVYKEHLNIELVTVITAVPLQEPLTERVMQVARTLTSRTIEFHQQVDPSLIGGFILRLGHTQYDASVKRKLAELKKNFEIS
ncbi:MAG: ATP synthase F1 subunit delta [Bacteroidales bacterium]